MLRYRHLTRILRPSIQRSYSASDRPAGKGDGDGDSNPDKHPLKRTLRLLRNDMRSVKNFFLPKDSTTEDVSERLEVKSQFKFEGDHGIRDSILPYDFQTHCDVLIIGGGGIGSSIAFWLKKQARDGLNVVVVEKDDTYTNSATRISVGGLHQKFALPESIQMSLFAVDFLRNSKEHFHEEIPLNYTPHGHLLLADEAGAELLMFNTRLQNELGARNELMTPERLSARFPWVNTTGVVLASHGMEKEGWFDPWALLTNFRRNACGYGAHYVQGEVVDFIYQNQPDVAVVGDEASTDGCYEGLHKAVVQLPDGTQEEVRFALCIIAAGAGSAEVARLARVGKSPGMLSVPLPVVPRKRYVYAINTDAQNVPGLSAPMVVDPNGTFFRRDGLCGRYICGRNSLEVKAGETHLDADKDYFETHVRPTLSLRVPDFANAKVVDSWGGLYEHNVYDENCPILGSHPYYNNLYIATGFSVHGIQQAPAVGRAIAELIMDGRFRTIDLSRLSFDRFIVNKPLQELNAV